VSLGVPQYQYRYTVLSPACEVITRSIIDSCSCIPQSGFNYWFVDLPDRVYVSKVSSTLSSVALLSRCGRLFSWGADSGHPTNPQTPTPIKALSTHGITDIAAGETYFICCAQTGQVFTWGRGTHCLGHGDEITVLPTPTPLNLVGITSVAATSSNSFAISGKSCYVWGSVKYLLGKGKVEPSSVPLLIDFESDVKSIHAGVTHIGVLLEGKVYMWGSNNFRQSIPQSDRQIINQPFNLKVDFVVSSLSLSPEFTLALSVKGKVYGWGRHYGGVVKCITHSANAIMTGQSNACSSRANKFFSWGDNKNYQLGLGSTTEVSTPHLIEFDWIPLQSYCPQLLSYSLHSSLSILSVDIISDRPGIAKARNSLLSSLEDHINDETLSDLTIVVGEKKIHTSKVCSVVSPVDSLMLCSSSFLVEANISVPC
jgi:hypothetical protein